MVKRSIITVEFSRIKEEDIQLYLKLKEFDKPCSIIKDILKGRLPLSILQEEQKKIGISKKYAFKHRLLAYTLMYSYFTQNP